MCSALAHRLVTVQVDAGRKLPPCSMLHECFHFEQGQEPQPGMLDALNLIAGGVAQQEPLIASLGAVRHCSCPVAESEHCERQDRRARSGCNPARKFCALAVVQSAVRAPAGHKLQVVLVPTAKDAAALLACSQAWTAQTWGGRLRIWALQQLQARDVSQQQRSAQAKFESGMGHRAAAPSPTSAEGPSISDHTYRPLTKPKQTCAGTENDGCAPATGLTGTWPRNVEELRHYRPVCAGEVFCPLDLIRYHQKHHTVMLKTFGGYLIASNGAVAAELAKQGLASVTLDGRVSHPGSLQVKPPWPRWLSQSLQECSLALPPCMDTCTSEDPCRTAMMDCHVGG